MLDDEVVSIEIVPYDGQVYNLSVEEDETYVLNNIITHNCLCYSTAVLQPEGEFVERLRGWMSGGSDPGLDGYAGFLGVQSPQQAAQVSLLQNAIALALQAWLFGGKSEIEGRLQ